MSETKPELSWPDFTKQVFTTAMKIVENSSCSTFKLMGYKYLDVRLILYFHDCNQVFDFSKGEFEVEMTKFFTKDKIHEEEMIELGEWKTQMEKDVPEDVKLLTK
jgi:hypothetical protein